MMEAKNQWAQTPCAGRHDWVAARGLAHECSVDDGTAAIKLLAQIRAEDFPRLIVIFGDSKYHNHDLEAWLKEHRPGWRIEVKKRPEGTTGFIPLPKRWVVDGPTLGMAAPAATVKIMTASPNPVPRRSI